MATGEPYQGRLKVISAKREDKKGESKQANGGVSPTESTFDKSTTYESTTMASDTTRSFGQSSHDDVFFGSMGPGMNFGTMTVIL